MTESVATADTALARRYRAALRWYPRRWRNQHGEDMVGTLLDVADGEGRSHPSAGELVDLRWRGVVERVNVLLPERVRALAASLATGAGAAFAVVYFVFVTWVPWGVSGPFDARSPMFGPFWNAGVLVAVPMVLVALAALGGWRAGAHLAGLLVVLGVVMTRLVVQATDNWNGPGSTTLVTALLLVVVTSLGDPRNRVALTASAGVVGVGLTTFALLRLPSGNPFELTLLGDGGWWTMVASPWMLAGAALIVAAAVVVLALRGADVVAAAIAVGWLPWGAAGTITLRWFAGESADAVVMAVGSVVLTAWVVGRARRRRGDRAETV